MMAMNTRARGEQTEEQKTARLRMALFPKDADVLFVHEELYVSPQSLRMGNSAGIKFDEILFRFADGFRSYESQERFTSSQEYRPSSNDFSPVTQLVSSPSLRPPRSHSES